MKFCANCDTKLTQTVPGIGKSNICPKCNPEQIIQKKPNYGFNYSGKTKICSKGCGSKIYWDEGFKSDSGKFIPMDVKTNEPHRCDELNHQLSKNKLKEFFSEFK